jgi:MFS family permease
VRIPAALTPLRHRSFAALWIAGMVSNAGSWMETVAVGSLLEATTGRTTLVAIAAIAAFLPLGLLSPVGGALADRVNRRRLLIVLNCFEAAVASALAVLAARGEAKPAVVIALVFVEGCSGALRLPVLQSLLPDLVPAEELLAGVSLGTAQYNIGRVLGPALASVVIAAGSFQAAFAINALSFFAAVAAVAVARLPPPGRRDDTAASPPARGPPGRSRPAGPPSGWSRCPPSSSRPSSPSSPGAPARWSAAGRRTSPAPRGC